MSSDDPRTRLYALGGLALALAVSVSLLLAWLADADRDRVETADANGAESREPPAPSTPSALLDRVAGGALRPGPLAEAHRDLEGMGNCTQCHGLGSQTPDARCLACHGEIAQRAAERLPLHGTFEGTCASCHPDHLGLESELISLDADAFQHTQTRYPLHGAHLQAECQDCHRVRSREFADARFRYQGVPFAGCASCHSEPHGRATGDPPGTGIIPISLDGPAVPAERNAEFPLLGRDCAGCHQEQSFRAAGLRSEGFDHDDDTLYALRGAHTAVDCRACHTPELREEERADGLAPGRAAAPDCGTCHTDPHRAALGGAERCSDCHVETGWTQHFDHAVHTRFALDPVHERIACGTCHQDDRFAAEGRECKTCHADADALLAGRWNGHSGQADPHQSLDCLECHGETLASNRTPALAARCQSCHAPSYGSLLVTWTSLLDRSAAAAGRSDAASRLRRSGAHNFVLARSLLDSLAHDDGAKGETE
ncbi:MAG: hypothetical protein JRG82_18460 [Deltaproteobacteria bacterium]|nr:hypothetical protein [Deltaproteobacteria bacterium]